MLRRILKRGISVILVIAMLFEISTPLVYAAGNPDEDYSAPAVYSEPDAVFDKDAAAILNHSGEKKDPLKATDENIVFEADTRRDEYQKGYRLKDGSEAVYLYPFSVFERSGDEWLEIDNTIAVEKDKSGRDIYRAESLSKEAVFYEVPEAGKTLELNIASGHISWGLADISKAPKPELKAPQTEEGYSKLQPKSVGTILTYKDVLPGTDLRYQLVGHDTEENVILNTPEAAQTASEGLFYRLSLEGYRAELSEKEILLYAQGSTEAEYSLTASYMEDANGLGSSDIELSLTQDEEGYIVTVYPSAEWLLSEERVYPIVIDPTIARRTSRSVLRATTVTSVSAYDPQYRCGTQHVGRDGAYYGKMRIALQFDLPTTLTESDMVIDAAIIAKQRGYSGPSGATVVVNAHRITTTATINNDFKWSTLDGHFDTLFLDSQILSNATNYDWVSWDITKTVKRTGIRTETTTE